MGVHEAQCSDQLAHQTEASCVVLLQCSRLAVWCGAMVRCIPSIHPHFAVFTVVDSIEED